MKLPARNQPCPCGSGRKFKYCCGKHAPTHAGGVTTQMHRQRIEQALSHHQAGRLDQALRLYDQALAVNPHDAGLLGLKGLVYYQREQYDEARSLINQGLALSPQDARLHNYLAQVLDAQGDYARSEMEFVQAVRLDPRYMEAWYNAGNSFLRRHKAHEAVSALREAYRLAPSDSETLLKLVEACFQAGKLDEARQLLQGAGQRLGRQAWQAMLWQTAIESVHGQGEAIPEVHILAQSIADEDKVFATLMQIGNAMLSLGEFKAAERWFLKAMELKPDVPKPYVALAGARGFTSEDMSLIDKMEALPEQDRDEEIRALKFALGKVCTDIGEYDRSFRHYQVANDLARRIVRFDATKYVAYIDRLIELFSTEQLAAMSAGSNSNVPIIIVGTPRSGTTLTESIISSHTQVAGAGEMAFWGQVMPRVMESLPDSYTPASASRLADEYLLFMRLHSQTAQRITDKMPTNFMHLGVIHAVFPKAKIIHCKRHPIDACLSMYFQNFNDSQDYKWDLQSLALWYEQYQRLMAHWRSVLPPETIFELQYEALVEDVEGESRRMMRFLGLDWEPGQLDFHKQERAVFTPSKWQVRQPIYKTSKERWRHYEKHLGPLLPLLKYA